MGKKQEGGFIGQLSESQQKALTELHSRIEPWKSKIAAWEGKSYFKLDDRILLKFLRARDFDVNKAEKMLTDNLEYREKWQPQNISHLDEDVKEALALGIWRLAGETKSGHPIQLIDCSKFFPKDLESVEQYTRNVLLHREATGNLLEANGWKVETSVVLFDMAGWSVFTHATPLGMSYIRILIDAAQNHYPEMLETAIILNAPFVFRTAWAIIRPWLDPATASRAIFVTDTKKLHDIIDPSVLYEKYGGTRKNEYPVIPESWNLPK